MSMRIFWLHSTAYNYMQVCVNVRKSAEPPAACKNCERFVFTWFSITQARVSPRLSTMNDLVSMPPTGLLVKGCESRLAIGVQMNLEVFESRFWAITSQVSKCPTANKNSCSNVEGVCPLQCDSFDLDCYVIDNHGFVLVSKQQNDAGRFLGEIDGSVMTTLIRMGMFKRVSLFDYQAMCKMNLHSVSSARPLLSSFYSLASALKWFLSNFVLFLLEFNICSFWHPEHFTEASSHKKKGDILQPCDTEYPSFIYEPSVKETNSIIKCGRCQKMFVVQQIPDSNLLMLVVQADCDCSRQYPPITMDPKEGLFFPVLFFLDSVTHNASVKCDRMRSQKIRRRPESCHAYHPQENANDCGGASDLSLSVSLFLTCLSFLALVSR
ncbi:hypothetical protein fugu_019708 [Takifugu bimaculatus]|uniref:Voltage-dependent calcium channel alpha-2/delta subunit conserved region domain-containing protein n=1 Tax=Takifugu bimaculatus TaxID=433685 RepID=A0A4Z2BHY4_9TELE|nr:hypothetical protein fugu_019708 [Takifugu bimaculatus]